MSDRKVVTRFAPSPTGFLHVGGVRTAIYAWFWARKNNGTFILRIEDTDKKREVEGSIDHIIKSLKWLGVEWDEGVDIGGPNAPYKQSERLDTYRKYANILIEKGLAYTDPYSEEEIENFRKKAQDEKKPFLFREHRPENPSSWDGTKPLRFKTNAKKYFWRDLVRGDLEAGAESVDDLILIKSDGYPTYNFAHIIDDLLMSVTHIFRADEFISSTPNYLALYEALEIKRPEFATLPPILGSAGTKKLGKRDGAKDILDYEKEGYLPEAMLNFLALIGWNPGEGNNQEIFSKEELIETFDLKHVQKAGAKFNEEKLDWMNREWILKQSKEVKMERLRAQIQKTKYKNHKNFSNEQFVEKFLNVILDRIHRWGEVSELLDANEFDYLFEKPVLDKTKIAWKNQAPEKAKVNLEKVLEVLDSKENITALAEKEGRGDILWPLRYALSGREKSPDPFSLLEILGVEESKERIKEAIKII